MPPEPIRRSKPVTAVEQLSDPVLDAHDRLLCHARRQIGLNHVARRWAPRWCRRTPGVRSMTTATAICGCSAGAKAMNQALFSPGTPVSAVPVLPATDRFPMFAAVPGALLHHPAHHRGQLGRGLRRHHALDLLGLLSSTVLPSGETARSTIDGRHPHAAVGDRGRHRRPSAAGWPAAAPGRSPRGRCPPGVLCGRTPCRPYRPLARHLVARVVDRRLLEEAVALHRRLQPRPGPPAAPICANTVLYEKVSASASETTPANSPPALHSGCVCDRDAGAACRRSMVVGRVTCRSPARRSPSPP